MSNNSFAITLFAFLVSSTALATPGAVRSNGCHSDHCHPTSDLSKFDSSNRYYVAFGGSQTVVAETTVGPGASATTVTGSARVVDGDTVVVNGGSIRLKGVDAAERYTVLGEAARRKMIDIVGSSKLTCELTGEKTWKRDVGYCKTEAGVDIGQAIIAAGVALACPRYSDRYLKYEVPAALAAQARASYCNKR